MVMRRRRLHGHPSPPCEGDRDQRWSDCGSVALYLLPSSFVFLFFLILVLRSAWLGCSSGSRDLLRLQMSGGHRVWAFIPVQVSSDCPNFGVDYSKLFLVKSPCHTRIVWKNSIRPLSGLLGWDQGSKSSAFPDIGCGGCS
uniref:Uncharacterized protein n=1 Tax=Fagus sylvatica TaxID=28930 RepID=A0A2N9IM21_FAGSY